MEIFSQISKKTNHDTTELIERILLIMTREKYGITGIKTDSVKFDRGNGGIKWRHEHATMFEYGEFKIYNYEDYRVVNLKYTPFEWLDVIFVSIFSIPFIIEGIIENHIILLIGLIFSGQLVFKYYNLKRIAKEILSEVVN